MTHLDSSFVIDLLREQARRQPGPASRWLEQADGAEVGVSLFVQCELEAGAAAADHPARARERIRALVSAIAVVGPSEGFAARYGATLAAIHGAGKGIGTMDLLIATVALEDNAPLLTANERHFAVVPDLDLLTYR